MKKSFSCLLGGLIAVGLSANQAATALPQMDITAAKAAITSRQKTPLSNEFLRRRVRDQPSFDKLGIGNYYSEYRLDAGEKLQIWMYVESAPPMVDEVVVYIYPAKPADVSFARAQKLLNIVYGESTTGSKVVADFNQAYATPPDNKYKQPTQTYQQQSLLPQGYDGGLYYLGKNFGYKVGYHLGGLQIDIHRRDVWEKFIMGVKDQRYPDPKPVPVYKPQPTPVPIPHPTIIW